MLVAWMDYPENASIIDPKEQQSDYYDRFDIAFFLSTYTEHFSSNAFLFDFFSELKPFFSSASYIIGITR